MNCERFLEQLPEYAEKSLPADQRRAADSHLADCPDCRAALQQAQTWTRLLSAGFEHQVQHLALPPDFLERIQESLPREYAEHPAVPASVFADWRRFLWPAAIAAGILLICFQSVRFSPRPAVATGISIQLAFRLPAWKFQQDEKSVVDTLSFPTIVATGILPGPDRSLIPETKQNPL